MFPRINIDPKIAMYAYGVVAVIAAVGVKIFPSYVPQGIAQDVVETCCSVVALVSGLSAYTHGSSSSVPGPLSADAAKPVDSGK